MERVLCGGEEATRQSLVGNRGRNVMIRMTKII